MRRPKSALVIEMALATFVVAGDGDSNAAVGDCRSQPGVSVLAVHVRVMTKELRALDGLKATDFALTENGVPQTVCGFAHVRRPLSMGILLDTSGSMRGIRVNLLTIAKAGIDAFLGASGPQDEYFLEYANAAPAIQCAFTSDLPQIRAKLETTPKGRTALVDAVYLALNAMRKARHANRALLIVSDAYDNQSIHRIEELTAAFSSWPLPIFLVILVERWRTELQPLEELSAREDLVRFANRSGGYATWVSNKQEMSAAVTKLASAIRSPYLLYFVSPASLMTQRPLDLQVEVIGVRPRPLVFYRGAIRLTQ